MTKQHGEQHWVPRSYLKAWCDPEADIKHEPYVWRISKDGTNAKKKAPKNIFYETDLYTIHMADGSRDLTVEHGLAGLEDSFAKIRDRKLSKCEALSSEEDLMLRAFIAAMHARNKMQLEHWQGQWKKAKEMMDKMIEHMSNIDPTEHKNVSGINSKEDVMSYEDVSELAEGPVGPMVVTNVEIQLPILARMNLSVLTTADPLGFLCSDNPCIWADPESYKRHPMFRSPGLGSPTVEVTLPASPEQMLVISWHPFQLYNDAPTGLVDELNRRTRFYCNEYFVARRNELRDIWFDRGKPPEG